jgi:hypothetical protein
MILCLIVSQIGIVFGQNKKDIIEILEQRVDSLSIEFNKEQKHNFEKVTELDAKVKSLTEIINQKELISTQLKSDLLKTQNEKATFQNEFHSLVDSLNNLSVELIKIKTLIAEDEEVTLNSDKIIDSVYSINRLNNLIMVSEIGFRNRQTSFGNNLELRDIDTKEAYARNIMMMENTFLFISFSSQSLPLESKTGAKIINISVLNQGKIIDTKSYYWFPDHDGNYYVWFPLEKKYFNYSAPESKFKIDIKEEKSNSLVGTAIIEFEAYYELD